jgi:hypothetical protein
MFNISSILVVAALAASQVTGTEPERGQLVAQCKQEALRGHLRVGRLLPSIGQEVSAHRKRMLAICSRWEIANAEMAPPLLRECLDEAESGPRVWRAGRDRDRDHVLRLKKLCRKLADATGASS